MPFDVMYALDLCHYLNNQETTDFVKRLIKCVIECKNVPSDCTLLEYAAMFLPKDDTHSEEVPAPVQPVEPVRPVEPVIVPKPELTRNKRVTVRGELDINAYTCIYREACCTIRAHDALKDLPEVRTDLFIDVGWLHTDLKKILGDDSDTAYALLGLALKRFDVLGYPDAHKKRIINSYMSSLTGVNSANAIYNIPDNYTEAIHYAFGNIPISQVVFISILLLLYSDKIIEGVFRVWDNN